MFFLANLADPVTTAKIPGANFLHAALETREDMLRDHPEEVARMVRILRRTLTWIVSHTPEQVVEALQVSHPEERQALLRSLKAYPRLYSRDGRFSTRQLAETERFFRTTSGDSPAARALAIESMVVDTWAGRKP